MIKIDDICLSTSFPDENGEGGVAKKYLDDNGVQYKHLHYADPGQWQYVFDAFATWEAYDSDGDGVFDKTRIAKVNVTGFPILHYDVITDDYRRERVVIQGASNIVNSKIVELSKINNGG